MVQLDQKMLLETDILAGIYELPQMEWQTDASNSILVYVLYQL